MLYQIVGSFLLESHFNQTTLQAVCVVDVKPVELQDKRTIIIGQKDKDYYNEQPRNDDYNRDDGYNNENTYDSSYGYEDNRYNSYHPY